MISNIYLFYECIFECIFDMWHYYKLFTTISITLLDRKLCGRCSNHLKITASPHFSHNPPTTDCDEPLVLNVTMKTIIIYISPRNSHIDQYKYWQLNWSRKFCKYLPSPVLVRPLIPSNTAVHVCLNLVEYWYGNFHFLSEIQFVI